MYARYLPEVLPAPVQRRIEEYAAQPYDPPIIVGGMVRLCVLGLLHDAYVVREEEDHVVLLAKCGADIRLPRSEIGGMRWPVDPDTNPPNAASLNPNWFMLATERPRAGQVGAIDVHFPPGGERAHEGSTTTVPPSCHRRVRLFAMHEDRSKPTGPPNFVYIKMHFPYLALRALPPQRPSSARPTSAMSRRCGDQSQHQLDMTYSYMREAAAYSVLHLCQPQVAPKMFYNHINENSGSYSIILEDVINFLPWDPIKEHPPPKTNKEEGQQKEEHRANVMKMKKVFAALATLHGRFMKDHEGTVTVSKDLLQAMVHPKIFYAHWKRAIGDDDELESYLAELYGVEGPPRPQTPPDQMVSSASASTAGTPPPTQPSEGSQRTPPATPPTPSDRKNSARGGPPSRVQSMVGVSRTQSKLSATANSLDGASRTKLLAYPSASFKISDLQRPKHLGNTPSLTLVHGRLHDPKHIRRHYDNRGVPSILFFDWKYSGIGPAEIDLLEALMLMPAASRRKDPDMIIVLLLEYLEVLNIFYPSQHVRSVPDLLCRMRVVALLMIGSDPFDWNNQGEACASYIQLHHELCEKTTTAQIAILEKRLEEKEFDKY